MADEKAHDKMAEIARTRVPNPTDVAVAAFHSGSHPQRPIPADLTDAEKRMLDQERDSIRSTNWVPLDQAGRVAPAVNAPVWVDPERPNKGVLFTGATAREEAMLAGLDPKVLDTIEKDRAERFKVNEQAQERADARLMEARSAPPTPIKK